MQPKVICPNCKKERLYSLDPFNGEMRCLVCKEFLGYNSAEGPMAKFADKKVDENFFGITGHNISRKISVGKTHDLEKYQAGILLGLKKHLSPYYITAIVLVTSVILLLLGGFHIYLHRDTLIKFVQANVSPHKSEALPAKTKLASLEVPSSWETIESFQKLRIEAIEKNKDSIIVIVNSQENHSTRIGTGIIFDQDGHIITNNHIISDAPSPIAGLLQNGRPIKLELLYNDPISDLAILKIMNSHRFEQDIRVPVWGSSRALQKGATVIAVGHPGNLRYSAVSGIVSHPNRYLDVFLPKQDPVNIGYFNNWVQVDASINQGFSGGPLLNLKGEIVGSEHKEKPGHGGNWFCSSL